MALREILRKRLGKGFFFSRTDTYTVTTVKKQTYFVVSKAYIYPGNGGLEGAKVPCEFHIESTLIGVNPDGSSGGLGGKTVRLIQNGVPVISLTTGSEPWYPNGQANAAISITNPGTYDYYLEFAGDDEWEGC